jgi:hypothetical protein
MSFDPNRQVSLEKASCDRYAITPAVLLGFRAGIGPANWNSLERRWASRVANTGISCNIAASLACIAL